MLTAVHPVVEGVGGKDPAAKAKTCQEVAVPLLVQLNCAVFSVIVEAARLVGFKQVGGVHSPVPV